MSLIGNSVLSAVFVGSTSYSAIYVGTQCVFKAKVDVTINLNYGSGNSGTTSIKGELNKSLTAISKSLPTKATSGNTVDPITWHTSSTFSTSNVFNNSTVITKNMVSNNTMTLYAEYSSSVIFHLNYDGLTYQTVKLNSDKTVTIPSAPTRDKYTFGGWYLNSACTGSAITSSTTFTQSTTVYAKWTKKRYTLSWNFDGGTASGSYTTAGTYNVDTTIVYPTVTKTNYTFNYWSPNPTKLTENTTIRAYWTQSNILVTGISLNTSSTSVTVGSTVTLIATVTPSNATNKTVTWSTNNSSVATVSNGVVTGKSVGTATITATAGGYSATCTVSVTSATIAVTGISLDKTSAKVATGKSITLTATVTPSNATNKTVTWSTSNSSIASVSNGTVTGKSAGTVTITATAGGKSATCSVTVVTAGTDGWVGSGNAGAISMDKTSFGADLNYGDVKNSTSAYVSSLRYRVYSSDGITYTDNTPTISYSWIVTGDGLTINNSNAANTLATYASRGTTAGDARTGTIKRRAKFTYGSHTTTLDSNSISVTQAANIATKVDDGITYGTPTLNLTNNLTAGGGSITCNSRVSNTESYHYTYTSGSSSATTSKSKAGTVTLSIESQSCAGVSSNRFTISGSTVSHTSMTTYVGTDSVTIKAVNNGDTSKSTTKEASVSNAITQTNKRGSLASITLGWVDGNGMDSPIVLAVNYNDTSWPTYLTCIGTYNTYNVYTSGSQAYSGTVQDYVSPAWSKPSWASISSTTLNGVSAYSITLTQNNGTSDRSGTITATSGSATASVTIKQLCKPQATTQSIGFKVANVIWNDDYTRVSFKLQGYASPSATITNVKVIATTSTGKTVTNNWLGSSYTLTSDYSDLVPNPGDKHPLIGVTISNIDYNTTFKVQYTYGSSIKTVNLGMPKPVIDK